MPLLGYFATPIRDHFTNRSLSGTPTIESWAGLVPAESPGMWRVSIRTGRDAAKVILVKKVVSALVLSSANTCSSASTAHLFFCGVSWKRQALLLRSHRSALAGSSCRPSSAPVSAGSGLPGVRYRGEAYLRGG